MISPSLWEQLPFGDVQAWTAFLGEHAQAHTLIATQAVRLGKPRYATYPLGDGGGVEWLTAHYFEHRSINHSLSLTPPPDLASYDLTDPEQFGDWLEAHAAEHERIHQVAVIP